MNDALERWRRIESVVDELAELSEEDRRRALDGAGDPLRQRVASLLAPTPAASEASEQGGTVPPDAVPADRSAALDPLAPPLAEGLGALWESAVERRGPGLAPGERVGPYRLERVIGEGGMGTVFLAHRADGGFEQEVALKVLHRGPADEAARHRFLQERQILAGLRHPHIARLLDGGMARDRPYLVMERIEGVPITDFCEARRLGPEERIRLLLQTCDALRYAHRQGVIHRDVKP
ncbi:MAG: serine/threonine protein kinase, partial [Holophagales bacterium]|nr:serine/threonine protein kinase [Holophagales bacterium]